MGYHAFLCVAVDIWTVNLDMWTAATSVKMHRLVLGGKRCSLHLDSHDFAALKLQRRCVVSQPFCRRHFLLTVLLLFFGCVRYRPWCQVVGRTVQVASLSSESALKEVTLSVENEILDLQDASKHPWHRHATCRRKLPSCYRNGYTAEKVPVVRRQACRSCKGILLFDETKVEKPTTQRLCSGLCI